VRQALAAPLVAAVALVVAHSLRRVEAEAHWLRVEDPTSRSRQSTDGWLLGRVVAAPRHSFDIDPSTARWASASAARIPRALLTCRRRLHFWEHFRVELGAT
jgi:hypothetical protein